MLVHRFSTQASLARVVVLGASGFIGRRLVQILSIDQTPCLPIGRVDIDLTASDCADRLRNVLLSGDSVVMLSALTPEQGRDRATFLKNIAMVDNLCAALSERAPAHLVYVSSDSVYDWRCANVDENTCCESNDMYALSHIVREKLLIDACARANLGLAIVRPTAVYGPADTHGGYGPNRFLRSSLQQGNIALFGRGEEQRDHIFVDDLCRLIHLCLLHRSSGVLNAATGAALSFSDVAIKIADAVGNGVRIEEHPRQVPIRHRSFDTSALTAAFPQFRTTSFDAGIRETLQALAATLSVNECQRNEEA